ncbi:FGGY-family carbohydrate kinase [Actibacterium ureilyticum]|uniref:FGGY-family carbohydrate kinase n=1 Tax=Actibacterium ureilyticum TaxID=1590614 RepID=UPI000BAB1994|nr:FGGY-family carbohydrate kinase [Actibacterium ureilyticum]
MTKRVIIAIDAGGTAVKVVAFDLRGNQVAARAANVETQHLGDGRVERALAPFWAGTVAALRQIVADCADHDIAALACTGFGNGLFLVDADGRGTRNGIVSVDHRAQPLVDDLTRSGIADRVSRITGHRLWGGQSVMMFAYLARAEPEVMARTRWVLACKDAIRFLLTGAALTDPTDASGGGLMDLDAGVYAHEALAMLDLDAHAQRLPAIVPSDSVAGRVSASAAELTGLPAGLPVAGSMMDVAACALGAGAFGADVFTMIAGTWSINSIEATGTAGDSYPILNMLYGGADNRLVAEGSPCSAANLSWYLDKALGGRVDFDQANALVADAPIAAQRCQFLPYVFGPAPKRGGFFDLGATDDLSTMLRAIFEGVAFQARRHAEDAVALAGRDFPPVIRLAGGAAKSPVWCQSFADICQRPVEAVHAAEVGALGAAICAAVAAGDYADLHQAVGQMTRVARRFTPDPAHAAFYDERFARFRALDAALTDLAEPRPATDRGD